MYIDLNRSAACLASAVQAKACSKKVTFRVLQFEPLHTEHPHSGTGRCTMRGKHPYHGAFQTRKTIRWSGKAIITGSVSCVTSQYDFVEAALSRRSQLGWGPVRNYLAR